MMAECVAYARDVVGLMIEQLPSMTVTSPGAEASTAPTGTTSSMSTAGSATSSPSAVPSSPPSTGLSTAGKAGLGAALGLAAIIAVVVLGLFYRGKRAQKRARRPQELAHEPYAGQDGAPGLPDRSAEQNKHELWNDGGATKYEMPVQTMVEVDAKSQERPAELMGDGGRR